MEDDLPLRRRVPGAARSAPAPSARPVLADSVLLRMQAAIDAAKTELDEHDKDPDTEPIPAVRASRTPAAKTPAADARPERAAKSARKPKRDPPAPPGHTQKPDRLAALYRRKRDSPAQGGPEPGSTPPAQIPAAAGNGPAPRSPSGSVPPWSAAEAGPATPPERTGPAGPETKPERPALPKRTGPARLQPGTDQSALPKRTAPAQAESGTDRSALPKRTAPAQAESGTAQSALPARAAPARPPAKPEQPAPPSRTAPAEPDRAPLASPAAAARSAAPTAPTRPAREPDRDSRPDRGAPPPAPSAPERQPVPARAAGAPSDTSARPAEPRERSAPAGATSAPPSRDRSPGRDTTRPGRPPAGRRKRAGMPRLVAAVVAVALIGGGAAAYALFGKSTSSTTGSHPLTALQRAEASNRARAVTWVVGQVSPSTVVSCDPQTCAGLVEHGYPKASVRPLGPTSNYPKDSSVVIETTSVQHIFGTSLAVKWAPEILDSIGSGSAQVTIRVIAPDGSAAYQRQLQTDLAQRKQYGAALIGSRQIGTPKPVSTQLAAGQVDTRLLFAILAMGSTYRISVVDFGSIANDPSSALPLRYADLAEHVPAAHLTDAAYVRDLLSVLKTLEGPFRPLWTKTLSLPNREVVLRIAYSAPSPLNLPLPGSPPSPK
jgi:hypothetical protein